MSKSLFICSTPLMLINVLNLTVDWDFTNNEIDIVLTDESNGMKDNAIRLKRLGLFRHVFYVEIKKQYKGGNLIKKIRKNFYVYDSNVKSTAVDSFGDMTYDDFYFTLFDILSNQLFNIIRKKNPKVKAHRYEEGYADYVVRNDYSILSKFIHATSLIGGKPLEDSMSEYFLYHPDWLYYSPETKTTRIRVPNKNNKKLIERLNIVFDYKNEAELFDKRVIFFEESFFADNKGIDDYSLISELVKLVGSENIQIKTHPRNSLYRFADIGVKEVKCNIPWEVIWMNGNFDETTLVSISSGSIVNLFSWGIQAYKTVLLFKLLDKRPTICNEKYENFIAQAINDADEKEIYIPSTKKEFEEIFRS